MRTGLGTEFSDIRSEVSHRLKNVRPRTRALQTCKAQRAWVSHTDLSFACSRLVLSRFTEPVGESYERKPACRFHGGLHDVDDLQRNSRASGLMAIGAQVEELWDSGPESATKRLMHCTRTADRE
jgi:hypothetical protein